MNQPLNSFLVGKDLHYSVLANVRRFTHQRESSRKEIVMTSSSNSFTAGQDLYYSTTLADATKFHSSRGRALAGKALKVLDTSFLHNARATEQSFTITCHIYQENNLMTSWPMFLGLIELI